MGIASCQSAALLEVTNSVIGSNLRLFDWALWWWAIEYLAMPRRPLTAQQDLCLFCQSLNPLTGFMHSSVCQLFMCL